MALRSRCDAPATTPRWSGLSRAHRQPADRGQSAPRARRCRAAWSGPCAPRERGGGGLGARRRDLRGGRRAQPAASARPGLPLIEALHRRLGRPVNILTHCNAGWLATVDWGTATAPIYMAHDRGRAGAGLRRRDAAAQPGRGADRLRTRPAWRAVYGDRRQRRRPSDAARPSRSLHRRRRPRSPRAATPPTRSAPISRRSRRAPTACRSMSPRRTRRSTGRSPTASARSRSRSATRGGDPYRRPARRRARRARRA